MDKILVIISGSSNAGIATRISKKIPVKVEDFLEIWEMVPDAKSVVYAAMVLAVAEIAPTVIATAAGAFRFPSPPVAVKADASEDDKSAWEETKNWLEDVVAARVPAMRMLLQLSLCYKVKHLKAKNLKGFFSSRQNTIADPAKIHGLIVQVYSAVAGSFETEGVEDLITGDSFMLYHTLYSSSAGLVKKWLDEVGDLLGDMVPVGTKEAVEKSVDSFWSSEENGLIPKMAIVHTYSYLTASGFDFGSWYQGKRALAEAPGFLQAKIDFFYVKLVEVCAETGGMKDKKTAAALIAAFKS